MSLGEVDALASLSSSAAECSDLSCISAMDDVEVEPITPAQTTFLKLLDSYLQTRKEIPDTASYAFLASAFRNLLLYTQGSLRVSLAAVVQSGRSIIPTPDEKKKDPYLVEFDVGDPENPKVCRRASPSPPSVADLPFSHAPELVADKSMVLHCSQWTHPP